MQFWTHIYNRASIIRNNWGLGVFWLLIFQIIGHWQEKLKTIQYVQYCNKQNDYMHCTIRKCSKHILKKSKIDFCFCLANGCFTAKSHSRFKDNNWTTPHSSCCSNDGIAVSRHWKASLLDGHFSCQCHSPLLHCRRHSLGLELRCHHLISRVIFISFKPLMNIFIVAFFKPWRLIYKSNQFWHKLVWGLFRCSSSLILSWGNLIPSFLQCGLLDAIRSFCSYIKSILHKHAL